MTWPAASPDPDEAFLHLAQRIEELEQSVLRLAQRPGEEAHSLYTAQQFLLLREESLRRGEHSFLRLAWLAAGVIVLAALLSPLYLQMRAEAILTEAAPQAAPAVAAVAPPATPSPPPAANDAAFRLRQAAESAESLGRFEEAMAFWGSIILLDPEDQDARRKQIRLLRSKLLTLAETGAPVGVLFDQLTAAFAELAGRVATPASVLREWGEALAWRGSHSPDPEAKTFFEQARERFAASEKAGGDPLLHESWAEALRDRALRLTGKEAETLFAQAQEQYAKALAAKPDDPGILGKWAIALNQEGQALEGEAGRKKMAQAVEKLRAVVKATPNHAEAVKNLAIAMTFLALREGEAEKARLFGESAALFARAAKADPKDAMIPYNWATSLFYQASQGGEGAEKLFQDSFRRFEEAARLSPDAPEIRYNWGMALREKALRTVEPREADKMHEAAHEQFAQVMKRQPGHVQALRAWGESLTAQAQRKNGADKEALLAQAREKEDAANKQEGKPGARK